MKKFFKEFKAFITRGNVLDMAVGVIVGGAFTAIVNGLSNNILKPLINYVLKLLLGKNSLNEVYTFLGEPAKLADGTIDLANSIYIDWGAFINAIINFILIAFVLFVIVKLINKAHGLTAVNYHGYTKEEYRKLKKEGKSKEDIANLAKQRDEAAAEAKRLADLEAKRHSTEGLLEDIKALLEQQVNK
jgi:large conductance mechanosensitive channel